MIGLAKPYFRLVKNPTGIIDTISRAIRLFLYGGIALGEPAHADPRVIQLRAERIVSRSFLASNSHIKTLLAQS